MTKKPTKSDISVVMREIASQRTYTLTCECGTCKTCKQRAYRRKRREAGKT